MASEVDICNLALSHLGNVASVASLDEDSAEADYCRRWYPIVRDELLEKHDWSFATQRVALAQVTNPSSSWVYAYAAPSLMQRALAVLPADATDDHAEAGSTIYPPRPFALEATSDGSSIILTDEFGAVLRYTALVTDAGRYPAAVVMVLAAALASKLAGPIIKGSEGATTGQRLWLLAYGRDGKGGLFAEAARLDSSQKRSETRSTHTPAWLAGR